MGGLGGAARRWQTMGIALLLCVGVLVGVAFGAGGHRAERPAITNGRTPPPPGPGQPCVVPKVRGLTVTSAKRRVVKARCAVGAIKYGTWRHHTGRVIRSHPPAGDIGPPATRVDLRVAR